MPKFEPHPQTTAAIELAEHYAGLVALQRSGECDGRILYCQIVSAVDPYYLRARIEVRRSSGKWMEVLIPHQYVVLVVTGETHDQIVGFAKGGHRQ